MDLSILAQEMNMNSAIPRPIPTMALPKMPTTISATTTSSSNSNTKLTARPMKTMPIGPPSPRSNTSSPDPNKPIINPVTNRKSYDHIGDRELRKKLKNRESAQAARDRKKAKMLALERQLSDMAERNKLLENENRELRTRLQRIETDAFWRLVKNPGEGGMEGAPNQAQMAAAMINQGMHPQQAQAMAQAQAAQMMQANQAAAGQEGHPENPQAQHHQQQQQQQQHLQHIQQMQAEQQKQLYQRQMQFLLEGNPAAAAAFHQNQIQQAAQAAQAQQAQQTTTVPAATLPLDRASSLSPIESLGSLNYSTLRGLTKGEPMDDDPLPDLPSPDSASDNGAEGLDDWILRNFKGEASPLGSSPNSKSQGYSSAGCESPDASSSSPESPSSSGQGDSASSTTSQAMKTIDQLPINWSGQAGQSTTGADRLESTDSAFSECNFSNRLNTVKDFVFKNEKN